MAGVVSSLRESLQTGRIVGTFVKLPAPESVDICAASLDFCVVDYEHSQLAEADVLHLVRHAAAVGFPAVVRIQLETRETDNPPAELCRAGADVAFLGLTDLLVDCDLDEGVAAVRAEALAAAAGEAGIVLGGFGAEERFRYSVVSSDVALLREAVAGVR
jgi:hypothetical protein